MGQADLSYLHQGLDNVGHHNNVDAKSGKSARSDVTTELNARCPGAQVSVGSPCWMFTHLRR